MKKKILAALATLAPGAVLAEGGTPAVPASVQTAITTLEGNATAYANAISPFVVNVGVAFLAIAAIAACFGVIMWGLRKARPGR